MVTERDVEPGYYADGRFGIRIEDIVIVRKAETRENFGGVGFLKFERVTMVCSSPQAGFGQETKS